MGLLLSHTHLHGENNSPQSAFYTDRFFVPAHKLFLQHKSGLEVNFLVHSLVQSFASKIFSTSKLARPLENSLLAFPFLFSFRAMSLLRNTAQSNQAKLVVCRDVHAR